MSTSLGWIYCLSNPSYREGLYKIGCTETVDKTPQMRAEQLFKTGVPEPFVVECAKIVKNPYNKESTIHKLLGETRNHKKREFFNSDLNKIKLMFDLCDDFPEKTTEPVQSRSKQKNLWSQSRFVINGNEIKGKNGKFLRVSRNKYTYTFKLVNQSNWTKEALRMFENSKKYEKYNESMGSRLEEANIMVTIAASNAELEEEETSDEEEGEGKEEGEEKVGKKRKKRKWQIDMERCFINGQNIRHRLPRRNNNTWNGNWCSETKTIICKQNNNHYKSLSAFANAHADYLKRNEDKPPTKEDGWKTCECQQNVKNNKFWIDCKTYRKNKLETM